MFIAEFKRAYERELLKKPGLQRFVVSTNTDKNKIVNQRDYITSAYYRTAKRKTKRNNKLVETSSRSPRVWNSNLREILGGTQNNTPTTSDISRIGTITGNDSTKIKVGKYKRSIKDRKVPVNNPRNTFSKWNERVIIASKFPYQKALPPSSRPVVQNLSSMKWTGSKPIEIPSSGAKGLSIAVETMPKLARRTNNALVHTPIKAAGANKYLVGGVVAGLGLLGAGAYSLYRNNRNNKNKR